MCKRTNVVLIRVLQLHSGAIEKAGSYEKRAGVSGGGDSREVDNRRGNGNFQLRAKQRDYC